MTKYDKFAFRKKKCHVCKRRFRFEPYNEEVGYSLFGDVFKRVVCYKCANKASEALRKESEKQ